ncbi:hypothetical protein BMF94_2058 [Rhodotorula taiwanensis]|uniref:Rab-GAP TBC domain-containing protein n=1 Tax=Rhodotorula taiwanensis TaxID=741276 RepID=A0A2S5BDD1_9BASI|nr:hypothetical protein BMF94_2058 [Rhodotorula taiwanensis]
MQRHEERVQRFESLLRPFAATPEGERPSADNLSASHIGELPPGHGRGPRSAEAWRREELRKLCGEGESTGWKAPARVPDDPKHLRATAYRFLLNLDEPEVAAKQYRAFLDDVNSHLNSLPAPFAAGSADAPLAKEDKLLKEIEQDTERTFGALAWFGTEQDCDSDALWTRLDAVCSTAGNEEQVPSKRTRRSRRQILLRPLFLYAYLNPGVSFVQGMSYVAAVFFYVFSQPRPQAEPPCISGDPQLEAEASTFFALSALLAQLRDLFLPALDGLAPSADGQIPPVALTTSGIGSAINRFKALLLVIDSTAADALDRKGVDLSGLVVRWLTTLFANEFPLPDVVRIWDRVLSLYPLASEQQTAEALSPVLGHLIDLALAIIELERSKIITPFAKAPKILATLQDLQIEGEGIDRLLSEAWDIRERRLGRAKRQSVVLSTPTKTGAGFGRMFGWSPSSAKALPSSASDFEVDDRSSVAGSETSKPAGHRFGSLAFSSPRSSQADLAENVTVVEGKVLPPPPARLDQHVTIASLIEEEMRATEAKVEEPEYGIEDDDDEEGLNEGPALHRRVASGWGGLKASFSRFAASDTAAELSKRATNLQIAAVQSATTASTRLQTSDAAAAISRAQTNAAIKAQLLKDQLAESAPEQLAKLKDAAAGATGRLVASTDADRTGVHQPGSPREAPFVPPSMLGDRDVPPLGPPRGESADMGRTPSGGPKPLLLSGSARRAQNSSEDFGSERGGSAQYVRSPSSSPTQTRSDKLLSPDVAVPPLSRSPSRGAGGHGRSTSHWDTPTRTSASAFHLRSSSTAHSTPTSVLDDQDSPIVSRRLQDTASAIRRGGSASRLLEDESLSPAVTRSAGERQRWQLTDAPAASALELPPLELGFDPSSFGQGFDAPPAAVVSRPMLDDGLEEEPPFFPPSGPSEVTLPTTRPARGSSLSDQNGTSHAFSATGSAVPPRMSSLGSTSASEEAFSPGGADGPIGDAPLAAQPSLSRSKVVRRSVASRKRDSRSSATSGSIDLTGPEARRVASDFLTRSTSNASGHRRRASELANRTASSTQSQERPEFDEGDFLEAYGDAEVLADEASEPR